MRRFKKLLVPLLLCAAVGCGGAVSSGDRVLVSKFLYDSGLMPAQRYDVVVFRYPVSPIEKGTPKNYIKRLLGLPGELIAIFFGRLYRHAPPPEDVPFDYTQVDARDLWKPDHLLDWSTREEDALKDHNGKVDPDKVNALPPLKKNAHLLIDQSWTNGKFTILRKPLDTMMALRRIVYDNDKPARDLKDVMKPRWQPWHTAAWTPDDANGFHADGKSEREQWLRYQHLLRPANWPAHVHKDTKLSPEALRDRERRVEDVKKSNLHNLKPQLITDFMGYNSYETGFIEKSQSDNWVGDLMLECKMTVEEAKGECWLELSRGVDRFQACVDLATGDCTLYRLSIPAKNPGAPTLEKDKLATAKSSVQFQAGKSYQLRFANFDDRLTLWIDGDLPFGDGHTYPPAREPGPDPRTIDDNNDLQPASIASKQANVKVHQLKLWRDTYYTFVPAADQGGMVSDSDRKGYRAIYVHKGHYLCLGDNSPESSDSRYWGLVPERLMLGRALLVYFPLERMGRIK